MQNLAQYNLQSMVPWSLIPLLAAFDWHWLVIVAACFVLATTTSLIILLAVWITGGFAGR